MAIKFGLYNYGVFFSALSPLLIQTYLLFNSIFQGNLRGLVFLIGNSLASLCGNFLKQFAKIERGEFKHGKHKWDPTTMAGVHDHCDIFEPINSNLKFYGVPSSHAVFYGYALTYFALGIIENQTNKPGIPFFILMSLLATLDTVFRMNSKCDNFMAVGAGILIGSLIGTIWFYGIKTFWPNGDGDKIVYNLKDDVHNIEKCSLGKQSYKCTYQKV